MRKRMRKGREDRESLAVAVKTMQARKLDWLDRWKVESNEPFDEVMCNK